MKKLLIGTTALVAAGFVTSDAAAAEKIKIAIGGYFDQFVGVSDNEDKYEKALNGNLTGVDVQQDSEIHFKGSTKLDNGITVALKMELEVGHATDQTETIDETFMTITSPSMGTLEMGETNSMDFKLHNRAPKGGSNFNIENGDTESWVGRPGRVLRYRSTSMAHADTFDSQVISYKSPTFSGFTVAASYSPDDNDENSAGQTTNASDRWSVIGAYKGKVGDVSLGADIYYGVANGTNITSAGAVDSGTDVIGGGLKVGFGAFTVSGGYKDIDQNRTGTTSDDGKAWSVGGEFKSGPAKVALSWFHSEAEGTVATAADDEVDTIALFGSYDLGGGVSLGGTIVHADYDDETTTNANNNEGWAAVGAVQVKF